MQHALRSPGWGSKRLDIPTQHLCVQPQLRIVLYPNSVPRVQKCSERSRRSKRSARAEQFRTKIAIFGFSVTRQTAMPIRIVPRFCARGCGRFEKLLYGCRNPSRWDKTDVVAKISMLRLNMGSGKLRLSTCMLSKAQHWPRILSRSRQGEGRPPLLCSYNCIRL